MKAREPRYGPHGYIFASLTQVQSVASDSDSDSSDCRFGPLSSASLVTDGLTASSSSSSSDSSSDSDCEVLCLNLSRMPSHMV